MFDEDTSHGRRLKTFYDRYLLTYEHNTTEDQALPPPSVSSDSEEEVDELDDPGAPVPITDGTMPRDQWTSGLSGMLSATQKTLAQGGVDGPYGEIRTLLGKGAGFRDQAPKEEGLHKVLITGQNGNGK